KRAVPREAQGGVDGDPLAWSARLPGWPGSSERAPRTHVAEEHHTTGRCEARLKPEGVRLREWVVRRRASAPRTHPHNRIGDPPAVRIQREAVRYPRSLRRIKGDQQMNRWIGAPVLL